MKMALLQIKKIGISILFFKTNIPIMGNRIFSPIMPDKKISYPVKIKN